MKNRIILSIGVVTLAILCSAPGAATHFNPAGQVEVYDV